MFVSAGRNRKPNSIREILFFHHSKNPKLRLHNVPCTASLGRKHNCPLGFSTSDDLSIPFKYITAFNTTTFLYLLATSANKLPPTYPNVKAWSAHCSTMLTSLTCSFRITYIDRAPPSSCNLEIKSITCVLTLLPLPLTSTLPTKQPDNNKTCQTHKVIRQLLT